MSNPEGIIGRIGDHALRERWQDCVVGDAVPEHLFPVTKDGKLDMDELEGFAHSGQHFERIGMDMTNDNGATWVMHYVWKRIA
jgi:hypothetical protein